MVIRATQRAPIVFLPPPVWSASLAARDPGLGRSFSPNRASTAGSSVMATSTAIATPAEAAMPITVRKGMFATASPSSAMITVVPAKTTAEPAVANDCAIASATGSPWPISRR